MRRLNIDISFLNFLFVDLFESPANKCQKKKKKHFSSKKG